MIERKNNIGKWKEALKRRAETAFINRDKDDEAVIGLLVKSQNRRMGVEVNETAGNYGR